ncbi:BrnT family toxin [Reyranella sp.]|uniref:BrnT family toxin n=1 Tax=Reyranella sp. TaxID=1929291 RepID=UPI003D120BDE
MAGLRFEWDARKSASNARKHGVTFQEAQSAFADPDGKVIDDPDHSDEENRYVLLAFSYALRLLVVVHTLRGTSDVIRIISARKATPRETTFYRRSK